LTRTLTNQSRHFRDIAAIDVEDGVVFDLDTISVQEIRLQTDYYPGLRVRVGVSIGPWKGTAAWDVSTGDPIALLGSDLHTSGRRFGIAANTA
jgi:hypothetical protein